MSNNLSLQVPGLAMALLPWWNAASQTMSPDKPLFPWSCFSSGILLQQWEQQLVQLFKYIVKINFLLLFLHTKHEFYISHVAYSLFPLDSAGLTTGKSTSCLCSHLIGQKLGTCLHNLQGILGNVDKISGCAPMLRTSSDGQPAASVLERLEAVIMVKTQDATYKESSREEG